MPYRYTLPINVTSPRDCVKNIQIIFDGGTGADPFAVARLEWQGVTKIAMRWNVAEREWDQPDKISGRVVCKGLPVSRGYPVWFVLPDGFAGGSDVWKDIQKKLKEFGINNETIMNAKLSDSATYERARRLANLALWTVDLQRRRLNSTEPEDAKFVRRQESDFQFLIVALTRLRRAAVLASKVTTINGQMQAAIKKFDDSLPNLKKMRDTAEHIDEYAVDSGWDKSISRKELEVSATNGEVWEWLGCKMDVGAALATSVELFEALKNCKPLVRPPVKSS